MYTEKYRYMMQNSLSLLIATMHSIRLNYQAKPDDAIKAIDLCIKTLYDLKRGVIFMQNTGRTNDETNGPKV